MRPRCSTTNDGPRVPPIFPVRRSRRDLLSGSAALGLVVTGLILYYFNPTEHRFYPACLFHALTGLNCPGCGSLRALHHLTHGEFAAAFHCNPLLIVGLPVLAFTLGRGLGGRQDSRARTSIFMRPVIAWAICAIVIIFGVLRNVPGPACAWMSP